jgi:hypothetical protein
MIEGFTKAAPAAHTTQDLERAQQLASAVSKHLPGTKVAPSKWAANFRLLRTKDNEPDIDTVLAWYCHNISKPYTPQAMGGPTFRAKYTRIRQAMQRAGHSGATITPQAMGVAAKLRPLGWPPAALAGLAQAVADALATYTRLRTALAAAPGHLGPAMAASLADPASFVLGWFSARHAYWAGQPEYTLADMAWRPDHPFFQPAARTMAQQYTGRPKAWDGLLAELCM